MVWYDALTCFLRLVGFLMNQSGAMRDVVIPPHPQFNINPDQKATLLQSLRDRIEALGAVIVAHYYTDGDIQDLAEETGGFVADSLEMARFGCHHPSQTLIVAGVRFMGETAKILSPEKRVVMVDKAATCSLDLGCPEAEFRDFCDDHPERTVVVYANTSAAVKALSDWVVTSAIASDVVDYLHRKGEKILWAPDRHLGRYIQLTTEADMLLWQGACVVHEEFKVQGIEDLKLLYPDAAVLAHPESPESVVRLADEVGSTRQIIAAAERLSNPAFIIATDRGLFHKLRQAAPQKIFIEAPTAGHGATCKSCAHCPWMAMNHLEALNDILADPDELKSNEIHLDEERRQRAIKPLERMLSFKSSQLP